MKKVMILGAGVYQVPLIKQAQKQGFYTIVVSRPGNYPGFDIADKHYNLDTTDEEAVLKAARLEQIDGIATAGTDVAVRTLGRVCQELHLCGLPYTSALKVTDKYLMKQSFADGGVSSAKFCKVDSLAQAFDVFHKMTADGAKAVMIKAVDSSGSRGVTKVTTAQEVEHAYLEARSVTHRPYVLVEEFVEGHEIGVDGFICNGKITLLLPHEKFVLKNSGTTIPAGHGFPYLCSSKQQEEIRQQMELAIRALGLDNCAFNSDVLIGDKVSILEIGGRSGATGIPELISLYCGFSYYEKILENALGITPDFTFGQQTPCMSRLLFSPIRGTITDICFEELESIKKEGIALSLDYGIGDTIPVVHNGTDRIGQFLLKSSSTELLTNICHRIYSSIYVDGTSLKEYWDARKSA